MVEKSWWRAIGPGIITGASDDDPGGIATYSQAAAAFGYRLLWVMPLALPFVVCVQDICARVGRVTGHGIAGNLRQHHSKGFLFGVVSLLLLANVFNIGADLMAMGDVAATLLGGHSSYYAVVLAIVSLLLQIFVPYHRYVFYLRWLTLTLFSYVIAALTINVSWSEVVRCLTHPELQFSSAALTTILALLGTTISPYLFFWQASEEVEEETIDPEQHPLLEAADEAPLELRRIEVDTSIGMSITCLVAFFIMVTVSATLHEHGIYDIQTSAEAADALRPIAGEFAYLLFALGILGTGMLALPILAGSAAYAVGEAIGCVVGLEKRPSEAKSFYFVLSVATFCGLGQLFVGLSPMKALFWSAVLNGFVAPPLLLVITKLASDVRVMGQFVISRRLQGVGYLTGVIMALLAFAMLWTLRSGGVS